MRILSVFFEVISPKHTRACSSLKRWPRSLQTAWCSLQTARGFQIAWNIYTGSSQFNARREHVLPYYRTTVVPHRNFYLYLFFNFFYIKPLLRTFTSEMHVGLLLVVSRQNLWFIVPCHVHVCVKTSQRSKHFIWLSTQLARVLCSN